MSDRYLYAYDSRFGFETIMFYYVRTQKGVEPVQMLVPRYKDSRIVLSVEISNAESPTSMRIHHVYIPLRQ